MRVAALGGLLLVLLSCLGSACGGNKAKPAEVAVTLQEWSIGVSQDIVKPGDVVFTVTNAGTMPHELVIIKSDLPPEQLPVTDGSVNEAQVNIVGQIEPFAAGTTQTLKLKMTPGKYLLICNITEHPPGQPVVSHYLNGMVVPLLLED